MDGVRLKSIEKTTTTTLHFPAVWQHLQCLCAHQTYTPNFVFKSMTQTCNISFTSEMVLRIKSFTSNQNVWQEKKVCPKKLRLSFQYNIVLVTKSLYPFNCWKHMSLSGFQFSFLWICFLSRGTRSRQGSAFWVLLKILWRSKGAFAFDLVHLTG